MGQKLMKSLINKFKISNGGNEHFDIAIGSLYFLLRDYSARNYDDFNGSDIIVGMPVAINKTETWFYTLCIDRTHGAYVTGRNDKNLLFSSKDIGERKRTVVVPAAELDQILRHMPSHGTQVITLGGEWEKEVYVLSMYCDNAELRYMPIVPLDIKLTDIRQWPRDAISFWARYHLELSTEQSVAMEGFDQRWKMINYAQEVFTYKCTDYNPVALKKMQVKHKRPKIEKQLVDFDLPVLGARNVKKYVVLADHPEILNPHNPRISFNLNFIDPETGQIYRIRLERFTPFGQHTSALLAYVDDRRHDIYVGEDILGPNDLCLLRVNGCYLHLSLHPMEEVAAEMIKDDRYQNDDIEQNPIKYEEAMERVIDYRKDGLLSMPVLARKPDMNKYRAPREPKPAPDEREEINVKRMEEIINAAAKLHKEGIEERMNKAKKEKKVEPLVELDFAVMAPDEEQADG